MKTINSFLTAAILGTFLSTISAQSHQSITLVSSVSMKKIAQLDFQPKGDVTVNHWDQDYAQMEVTVSASGFNRNQLKVLVPLGLFRLEKEDFGNVATLRMPNLENMVTIGGKAFNPQFTFRLTLPRHTEVEQFNSEIDAIATVH